MLFAVTWVNRDGSTEEREKRSLKLFTNWKPPAGFDFPSSKKRSPGATLCAESFRCVSRRAECVTSVGRPQRHADHRRLIA